MIIYFVDSSASFYFTEVNASVDQRVRRALWDDLGSVNLMAPFWLVVGDFNVLFGAHEKT